MIKLIKELCVLKATDKPFVLASGKTSDYYVDIRKATMVPEVLGNISDILLWKSISFEVDVKLIAGVALGGCALATGISLMSAHYNRVYASMGLINKVQVLNTLYVRKEAKEHGTAKLIEGDYNPGDGVILVEDVITSGGSALRAIKILREAGLIVKGVVAVLDREEGGIEAIQQECPVSALVKMSEVI